MDYANTPFNYLVERVSGISLTRVANHFKFGDEYAGPCPFCGGDDRFHAWNGDDSVSSGKKAHYWCRGCGAEGSAPWFLVKYLGKSYNQACLDLGLDAYEARTDKPLTPYKPSDPPCKAWQEAGMVLLGRAERYLYSGKPNAMQALAYLYQRGFIDETIKCAKLGYVPLLADGSWFSEPFSHWGINPEALTEKQREKGCVRVPNGILIPWFCDGQLWKLAMKRLDAPKGQDYGQILGSTDGLYGVDDIEPGKPAMLVEGEFDALSVLQVAGDLIAPVATGSTKKGHHIRWIGNIAIATYTLIAFDNEEPKHSVKDGDIAAQYWLGVLPRSIRWAPWADENTMSKGWRFKDANDMLQYADEFNAFCGQTLRSWVETGIKLANITSSASPAIASDDDVTQPLEDTPQHALQQEIEQVRELASRLQRTSLYWNVPYSGFEHGLVSIDDYCQRAQACADAGHDSIQDELYFQIRRLPLQGQCFKS